MRIIGTVEIRAVPADVFPWLEDPQRALQWQNSVSGGEIIRETPDRVGTTFRETVEENGRGTELFGEITRFVPDELIAFHLEGKYNVVDVSFRVEKTDTGSRVIQDANVSFRGPVRVFMFFFGRRFKNKILAQSRRELERLKDLCEKG